MAGSQRNENGKRASSHTNAFKQRMQLSRQARKDDIRVKRANARINRGLSSVKGLASKIDALVNPSSRLDNLLEQIPKRQRSRSAGTSKIVPFKRKRK